VDLQAPRLYFMDRTKALVKASRRLCGSAATIQRCQAHKLRNLVDHLWMSRPRQTTLDRLQLPLRLHRSFSTTNPIESSFSMVDIICRNVSGRPTLALSALRCSIPRRAGVECKVIASQSPCWKNWKWQCSLLLYTEVP